MEVSTAGAPEVAVPVVVVGGRLGALLAVTAGAVDCTDDFEDVLDEDLVDFVLLDDDDLLVDFFLDDP